MNRALPMNLVARVVRAALQEDLGAGDLTSAAVVRPQARARGIITAAAPLVLAGIEPARFAFLALDPAAAFSRQASPGDEIRAGGIILEVTGSAAAILSAERTALNFLGRLSGIATLTRRCVKAVEGTSARIYDTRKTTPGLRFLEKDAVLLGGGRNHRFGLFDAILIKDNHMALGGGPGRAVREARSRYGSDAAIEVEVEDLAALEQALEAGADIILLDNMTVEDVAQAVRRARGRAETEASGGITLENIRGYAETGVDRISMGTLTHSAASADVRLALHACHAPP